MPVHTVAKRKKAKKREKKQATRKKKKQATRRT